MGMKVITNNVPRDVIYGFELSEKEKKEFDYYESDEELETARFFKYKGQIYDLDQFLMSEDKEWDGYTSDTYFSGMVVKHPCFDYDRQVRDYDHVVVGRYFC